MNKKFLNYFLCSLFSLTAFAQIQGGGGPDDQYAAQLAQDKANYGQLMAHLNKKWKECGNDPTLEFGLLSEVYLQLTWRKDPNDLCSDEKRKTIEGCFYDSETKKKIRKFIGNQKGREYMELLEEKQHVKLVLDYLKEQTDKKKDEVKKVDKKKDP